jgi:hypothetical protein
MAVTGYVIRKPMQRDLFTGNLVRQPKSGRGDHIILKRPDDEPVVIPGMAHFAATGPDGKRCSHCTHCQDIKVWGRDFISPDKAGLKDETAPRRVEVNACVKAAELYDGHAQKGGIQHNPACKYFEQR